MQRGFTLIEMLIVIVIIAVMITAATLSMNLFSADRQIRLVAEQLRDGIMTARQHAILMPDVLGLKITRDGYQYYHYVRDKKGVHWQVLKKGGLSHPDIFKQHRVLAKLTRWNDDRSLMELEHRDASSKMIVISSSGDVMPFTIVLMDGKHSVVYQLRMDDAGMMTLNTEAKAS